MYGMLVHRRSFPRNLLGFPNNSHLYSWVERGTVRVKCFAQEHNTASPARARTRTAHSGTSALTMRPLRLPYFWEFMQETYKCQMVYYVKFLTHLKGYTQLKLVHKTSGSLRSLPISTLICHSSLIKRLLVLFSFTSLYNSGLAVLAWLYLSSKWGSSMP